MQVRAATAADLGAIAALNETCVPAVSRVSSAGFEWFLANADCFRVVEIDGAVAGFMLALRPGSAYTSVNYRWFVERYPDFLYIDRLAVDRRFRRRGAASALYADVERAARSLGAPLLACEVNLRPRNEESLVLHQRLGFGEVGQQDTDGGDKRVSMLVKPLPRRAGA